MTKKKAKPKTTTIEVGIISRGTIKIQGDATFAMCCMNLVLPYTLKLAEEAAAKRGLSREEFASRLNTKVQSEMARIALKGSGDATVTVGV